MENQEAAAVKTRRNPFAKYQIDKEIQKAGILYSDEDFRVLVTYAGPENQRYERMVKLAIKPFETRIRNDDMPDKEFQNKVLAPVYAAVVVLNFEVRDYNNPADNDDNPVFVKGCYDAEGNIVEATEANITAAFRLGNRMFQDVIKVATNFNLFRQGQKEDDIKN